MPPKKEQSPALDSTPKKGQTATPANTPGKGAIPAAGSLEFVDSLEEVAAQNKSMNSKNMSRSNNSKIASKLSRQGCPICGNGNCTCGSHQSGNLSNFFDSPDQILGIGLNLGLIIPTGIVDIKVNPSLNFSQPPVNLCSLMEAQDRNKMMGDMNLGDGMQRRSQFARPAAKQEFSRSRINPCSFNGEEPADIYSSSNERNFEAFKKEAMGDNILIEPLYDSKEKMSSCHMSTNDLQGSQKIQNVCESRGSNVVQLNKVQMLNMLQGNQDYGEVFRKKKQKQDDMNESLMRRKCLCPLREDGIDPCEGTGSHFLESLQCCHVPSSHYLNVLGRRSCESFTQSVELEDKSTGMSIIDIPSVEIPVEPSSNIVDSNASKILSFIPSNITSSMRPSSIKPEGSCLTSSQMNRSSGFQSSIKSSMASKMSKSSSLSCIEEEEFDEESDELTCDKMVDANVQTSLPCMNVGESGIYPLKSSLSSKKFSWECKPASERQISMEFTHDETHSFAYKLALGKTRDIMGIHDSDIAMDLCDVSMSSMIHPSYCRKSLSRQQTKSSIPCGVHRERKPPPIICKDPLSRRTSKMETLRNQLEKLDACDDEEKPKVCKWSLHMESKIEEKSIPDFNSMRTSCAHARPPGLSAFQIMKAYGNLVNKQNMRKMTTTTGKDYCAIPKELKYDPESMCSPKKPIEANYCSSGGI